MTANTPDVLPSIRTLSLPNDEARSLFSRAVLLAQQADIAKSVKPWLDQHYSEQAVYDRLLPEKRRRWEQDERDLKTAPSPSELDGHNAIKEKGRGGRPRWRSRGFSSQGWRNKREWTKQHQEAAKHPNCLPVMAERFARLRKLRAERKNWRPTLKDRLRLAVDDIIKAEYPDPPEHIEHSRKIVAIAALLMPEPLPMLGELGEWPFASGLDLPEKPTGDWLTDAIVADATAASKGPHGYRPTVLDLRKVGREELLFERMPGEARKVEQCLPLDDLLKLLRVAVDELIKLPKADASLQTPPMLATADGPRHFDVFLCHNNKDKPAVKKIGNQLRSRGISPWLDEWELLPGVPWQRRLEEQIQSIAAAAVFVGSSGMGPWQQREVDALLLEFVNRGCPVIPVILSDCHTEPALPLFLRAHTWVDFRKADPDPMAQLIWGITQKKESNQPAR